MIHEGYVIIVNARVCVSAERIQGNFVSNLTFTGPCIGIYSHSKTNQMHLFLKLFILAKHSTCFGRFSRPSSGVQDCTYACYCMCSIELLMMDGKTVRNMWSVLQE
jgi:hypothetical protein